MKCGSFIQTNIIAPPSGSTTDGKLDQKGIDAWLKKLATDKAAGDLRKSKLANVQPQRMAKELLASIVEDQSRITNLMDEVTRLCSQDPANLNSAVNETHKFMDSYSKNLAAVIIHCTVHVKATAQKTAATGKAKAKAKLAKAKAKGKAKA